MSWVVILLFGVVALVPATAQVFRLGNRVSTENRVRSTFPQISGWSDAVVFPRRLESYVNDRFGLRQHMIEAHNSLRLMAGMPNVSDVIAGADGWLFYTAHKILEQHTGVDRFSSDELERWVRHMEVIRDWLDRRGVAFYVMIVPEKSSAYPEHLPDYLGKIERERRFDQLATRMTSSNVEFIDPRKALADAKASGIATFFAGDSHWTDHGAFIGYQALMKAIQARFPNLQPLRLEDYDRSLGKPWEADLDRMLAREQLVSHWVERLRLKDPSLRSGEPRASMRPGWNYRVEEFSNDKQGAPRLLVFGDSFTTYVMGPDMLYSSFRDPVWTHHNGGTLNLNLVSEFKPEIVVVQMAERYVMNRLLTPLGLD